MAQKGRWSKPTTPRCHAHRAEKIGGIGATYGDSGNPKFRLLVIALLIFGFSTSAWADCPVGERVFQKRSISTTHVSTTN